MLLFTWSYARDYLLKTAPQISTPVFGNSVLDTTVNISQYQHPSLTPMPNVVNPATVYTGKQVSTNVPGGCTLNPSSTNHWQVVGNVLYSDQTNDNIQIVTTAKVVTLTLTGIFTAGMGGVAGGTNAVSDVIYNGAIVRITTTSGISQTVDVFGSVQTVTLTLPGTSQTITITHTGTVGNGNPSGTKMIALYQVGFGTSSGAGSAYYTSQVIDAGDPQTEWYSMEWDQSGPLLQMEFRVGSTPVPSPSWAVQAISGPTTVQPSGNNQGVMGLQSLGRGRFAGWTANFVTTGTPWIRDVRLYAWNPATDPLLNRYAIGKGVSAGPTMQAIVGALATVQTDWSEATDQLTNSYAVSTAENQYLQAYAADLNVPILAVAEPPESIRTRVLAGMQSHNGGLAYGGGSLPNIAQRLAQLVNGVTSLPVSFPSPYSTATSPSPLPAGQVQVSVSKAGSQQISVALGAMPTIGYPGLLALDAPTAQQIIQLYLSQIMPAGCSLASITF